MNLVLVLGAGLSRAVSNGYMPLTDELGALVLDRLRSQGIDLKTSRSSFHDGDFEIWLSRLAEDQPDLIDAENAENRGRFLRVTYAIYEIMREQESYVYVDTFGPPSQFPPWWLSRLLGVAHAERASLITFNYDTLVEEAVRRGYLYDWGASGGGQRVTADDLVNDTPPLTTEPGVRFASQAAWSFRLLKLHGSVDSYWVPGDLSGATISRLYLDHPPPSESARQGNEMTQRRLLPNRSPYIVPPAAAKSAFYTNPISRELWRTAGEALGAATRVALVGYSLPATDLVTSGMLTDQLAGRDIAIDVVNPDPEPIIERLLRLGIEREYIRRFDGGGCVEEYVDALELERSREISQKLATGQENCPLLVGVGHRAGVVTDREIEGTEIKLKIEQPLTTVDIATQSRNNGPNQPEPLREAVLRELILNGFDHLSVSFMDKGEEKRARIVDLSTRSQSIGYGDGRWRILVPSAIPRS